MGEIALLCVLADRPYGSTRTFITRDLAQAISLAGRCGGKWYLVQFQICDSTCAAQATLDALADVRRWIHTDNPAWRDRLGDLLQTACELGFPRGSELMAR